MIRGLSFEIPNEYGSFLHDFLSAVDIEGYNWHIHLSDTEAYEENGGNLCGDLFPSSEYTGEEFKKHIKKRGYVIFLNLGAYLNGDTPTDIHSYEDFKNSRCEMLLFIIDCIWVQIFAKDEQIISAIKTQAENNGYKNIRLITDESEVKMFHIT